MSSAEEDFDQLFGEESEQELREFDSGEEEQGAIEEENAVPEEIGSISIKQITTPNDRGYIVSVPFQ